MFCANTHARCQRDSHEHARMPSGLLLARVPAAVLAPACARACPAACPRSAGQIALVCASAAFRATPLARARACARRLA
eukprot:5591508-Alexandrium_andersonii.AAC.1